MRLLMWLLLIAGVAGAYHWWNGRTDTLEGVASENGFVSVEMPEGTTQNTVLILAPPNCPSVQAQRAEALVQDLAREGIPVVKGDSILFDIDNPTAEQRAGIERAVAVFNDGAPAVFINGMAMSNPTASQAISEYRRTKARL